MALYKALFKMWLGVLEWSIGVREIIFEAPLKPEYGLWS